MKTSTSTSLACAALSFTLSCTFNVGPAPSRVHHGSGDHGTAGAGDAGDAVDHGDPGDPGAPGASTPPPASSSPPPAPVMETATRDTVLWKRYRAIENDLMRALALSKGELCNEVETFSCIDQAHLATLGGNEPFELAQYVPAPAPTVTTPFAFDRVVLSACSRRADLDAAAPASSRVVFTAFDLGAGSAVDEASLDALGSSLYRRLLARDALPEELAALQPLREDGTAAVDVAKLTCFAIGSSIEAAFQ